MRLFSKSMISVCLGGSALWAQSSDPPTQPGQTEPAPISWSQKYKLAWTRSVEPAELGRIAIGAGFDQGRNYPKEWGQGWDAFGVRMASGFGQHLIKEQIEAGIWALDKEDPRHHRSGLHGFWPRTRYAVVHTFITRRDDGSTIPAFSRFIGDYGAGFVSREWYPDRFHNLRQGIDAGSVSLGIDMGMNVLREFLPERLIK